MTNKARMKALRKLLNVTEPSSYMFFNWARELARIAKKLALVEKLYFELTHE